MSSPPPSSSDSPPVAAQPGEGDRPRVDREAALAETRPHAASAAASAAQAAQPPVRSADPLIGQCVRAYRIVRELGRGGMGVVYQAEHIEIGQRAAVKTLNVQRLGGSATDPAITQRFLTEAKALAIARHPGLVNIFDYGQLPDGTLFLLMEFLDGESLADRRDSLRAAQGSPEPVAALPTKAAVRISRQIADALVAAHEKGIFHRDLKPSNVFLVPDTEAPSGERVKILDFGLARIRAATQPGGDEATPTAASTAQTSTSVVMGTPLYMAPEQCRGLALADGQSDVYSLGVLLYELLAGEPPFSGDTAGDLIAKHIYRPPPPLARRSNELPRPLVDLVMRMLRKDPSERPSMAVVSRALRSIEAMNLSKQAPSSRSGTARRTPRGFYIALALGLLAVGLGLALRYGGLTARSPAHPPHDQPATSGAPLPLAESQPAAPVGPARGQPGEPPAPLSPSHSPSNPAPAGAEASPSPDPVDPPRAKAATAGSGRTGASKEHAKRERPDPAGTTLGTKADSPKGSTRPPGAQPTASPPATVVAPVPATVPPKPDEEVHVPALR